MTRFNLLRRTALVAALAWWGWQSFQTSRANAGSIAYQRGLTDYLNVLNAQTLLFKQQQVQQQVQAARLSAHAQLVTALGGGLGAGNDVPSAEKTQAPKTPALLH